jgi:hypothetical protein
MAKNASVLGIYPDRTTVSEAISILQKTGYRPADIAVLSAENTGSKDFAHEKRNRALEAASIGAVAGAIAAAAVGWLATRVTGFPGMESFAALPPVIAGLAGAGSGGTLGWIVGLLLGIRMTQYVAKRYAGRMGCGGILLSVHCDSPEWRQRAEKSLQNTGARHISCASESAADYGATDKPTPREPAILVAREPSQPVVVPVPELAAVRVAPVVIVDRDGVHEGRT